MDSRSLRDGATSSSPAGLGRAALRAPWRSSLASGRPARTQTAQGHPATGHVVRHTANTARATNYLTLPYI